MLQLTPKTDIFRQEIDEAIIVTLSLSRSNFAFNPARILRPEAPLAFMARYVRACVNNKQRALKVHGGVLDTIDYTATQLAADPEIVSAGTQHQDVVLDLCRMVVQATGFARVLDVIDGEHYSQKRYYSSEINDKSLHSTAHILPAAIYLGLSATINRLLEGEPDLNVESGYFWSPLCAAASTGKEDLVRHLLDKGADPYYGPLHQDDGARFSDWSHLTTPFLRHAPRAAAIRGHDQILELFLKTKDLSILPEHTRKAFLMASVRSGQLSTVHTINRYDPSLLASPQVKEWVMYEACARGHTAIINAMLEAGAPLDLFSISPYHSHNPNKNPTGLDPLKIAASFGRLESVKLLLDHGAPLQRPEEEDQVWNPRSTALALAVSHGYLQVSELLVERGAEINTGICSPLGNACSEGQSHMVRFLLERGCLANDCGDSGTKNAPRLWDGASNAIMSGCPSVAGVLKEFGVPGSLREM